VAAETLIPRILLADDDAGFRTMLRTYLEDRQCELLEAKDGEDALEIFLVEQPDLVVLDVMMPGLSGWEVCHYIKSKPAFEGVPVIMLTGIGHTVNDMTSPLYGADAHLDKDASTDLLEALDRTIGELLQTRGLSWDSRN
jgi:CheY-like chemotaxis protein